MTETLSAILLSLLLTLAVELGLGLLLGVRDKTGVLVIALVNCVTNPVVNLVFDLSAWVFTLRHPLPWVVLGALEIAAFAAEGLFYRAARVSKRPFLLSLALNGASFTVGMVITAIIHWI